MKTPDIAFTKFLLNKMDKKDNGVFIECGANTGFAGSVCYTLEKDRGWSGINIEPNPYCFEQLKKERPHSINVNKALYNNKSTIKFTFPTDGPRKLYAGQGSVVPKHSKFNGRPTETFEVSTDRLSDMLCDLEIYEIDLLVLDVEGAEAEAVEGMLGGPLPKYICIENDKVDFKKLLKLLDYLGYTKIATHKNNTLLRR